MRAGRRLRWSLGVGAMAALATGGIGLLHTPAGRPWLARLGVGCPSDKVTYAEVAASRRPALEKLRGDQPAGTRPAFGLLLDRTTEDEARAWAERASLKCKTTIRGVRYLKCETVPPEALGEGATGGAIDDLTLAFDDAKILIGVDTLRRRLSGSDAASVFRDRNSRLTADLGAPTETGGESSAAFLTGDALHTAFVHYRFSDYLASITATNIPGSGGIALHEQFQSAARPL